MRTKNFTHFPILSLQPDVIQEAADKYASLIFELNLEFENRFKKHHVLFWAFATPFVVDVNLLPGRLQIEHFEMCWDTQLKEKFLHVCLEELYKTYFDKNKYPAIYKHALSWFRYLETFMHVNSFSHIKPIKSQVRTRITDVHLGNCVRVATTSVEINFDALSPANQSQTSSF